MPQQENFSRIDRIILRRPGQNLAEGISPILGIPDYQRALQQHADLCAALKKCGVTVTVLNPDPQFPDGCLVGDMAVVAGNLAVLSNFSESHGRQGEQQAAAAVLAGSRFLKFISGPGRLDAADVLRIGNVHYVALSDHTNREGAAQLGFFLKEFGHECAVLDLDGESLPRLSAAATDLGAGRILIREELARNFAFLEYDRIVVPAAEKTAAGALAVGGTVILPSGCPETAGALALRDIPYIEVNISEFEKLDASLSCLALPLHAVQVGTGTLGGELRTGAA